jgi:hypothetical protein
VQNLNIEKGTSIENLDESKGMQAKHSTKHHGWIHQVPKGKMKN